MLHRTVSAKYSHTPVPALVAINQANRKFHSERNRRLRGLFGIPALTRLAYSRACEDVQLIRTAPNRELLRDRIRCLKSYEQHIMEMAEAADIVGSGSPTRIRRNSEDQAGRARARRIRVGDKQKPLFVIMSEVVLNPEYQELTGMDLFMQLFSALDAAQCDPKLIHHPLGKIRKTIIEFDYEPSGKSKKEKKKEGQKQSVSEEDGCLQCRRTISLGHFRNQASKIRRAALMESRLT